MTTQELYNKVVAGEVTQQKFLYEVRRDINLPFITSSNNFKDTVQILKNKGMISEKKLSTGKQDVEIYAKTIDMVNPYEYTRGMNYELGVVVDAIGNRISDNAGDSMHIEDLTKDDVLKAQKKVLKNLTKNPQYYQQKLIPQMEGETEYAIEVTAKSIADLKKKAGKIIREGKDTITYDPNDHDEVISNLEMPLGYSSKEYKVVEPGKIKFNKKGEAFNAQTDLESSGFAVELAEHGEYYDKVDDVNPNVSPLEEDEKSQAFATAVNKFIDAKGPSNEKQALDNLEKVSKDSVDIELSLDEELNEFDDSNITIDKALKMSDEDLKRLSVRARSRLIKSALFARKRASNDEERQEAKELFVKVANLAGAKIKIEDLIEGDTDYDRAKDANRLGVDGEENIYGAGVKKGEEIAAKKMAAKREAIYEKYANEYGVDVNELKDRLEAYKLSQEEAIEVEDEDTAIAVQKKSPEADVRIVNK